MKHLSLIIGLPLMLITSAASSQIVDGAWQLKSADKNIVLLFKDGYFTRTEFTPKEFLSGWGGVAKANGNQLKISIEFNSADSAIVGTEMNYDFRISGDQLELIENGLSKKYERIDDGNAALAGVWKISGREQEGKMVAIHQTGARKTLKMLTGNRFQWFAINPETKQFSGTGGGTYSFSDGKYTEKIEFFSRDNSRVGAQLTFDGKIENGAWHHSGLSSKGDPIHEIWSRIQ